MAGMLSGTGIAVAVGGGGSIVEVGEASVATFCSGLLCAETATGNPEGEVVSRLGTPLAGGAVPVTSGTGVPVGVGADSALLAVGRILTGACAEASNEAGAEAGGDASGAGIAGVVSEVAAWEVGEAKSLADSSSDAVAPG